MPSVYIKTYGCQMNERDSEAVAAQLVAKGYALAGSEATADVVLLNTCSVRDMAEQKALNKMQSLIAETRTEPTERRVRFHGLHGAKPRARTDRSFAGCRSGAGHPKISSHSGLPGRIAFRPARQSRGRGGGGKSEATIREHLLNGNARTL